MLGRLTERVPTCKGRKSSTSEGKASVQRTVEQQRHQAVSHHFSRHLLLSRNLVITGLFPVFKGESQSIKLLSFFFSFPTHTHTQIQKLPSNASHRCPSIEWDI